MYDRVLHGDFLSMAMIPLRYEKVVGHLRFLKSKNELDFPFLDKLLYIYTIKYIRFDKQLSIFLGAFFLASMCVGCVISI